ncbi:MAG: tRNA lysidine(34) synthetase TilS [Oscillospiraceae bacterium]|nr:tRNA lysidine(34) synthetase TilS [Oscillospiraceae bacterium]
MQSLDLTFLRGRTVTCAVSGGGDSVALLHLLRENKETLSIDLRAAHFHHGLRETADRDEAFVRDLCAQWGIELDVGRGDTLAYAGAEGLSVEEAARKLRYDFLLRREGLIALAHHGDDQVETVLLNLLRGTGLRGLCAMERQSGRLVRPLLSVSRAEIEAYLAAHDLPRCLDETNDEDDALRNRLRHHVIPLLKQENPALTETVGRMTALLQADDALLQAEAEALLKKAETDGGYDCCVLRASPYCRRAVRILLDRLEKPSMAHVDAVCGLMEDLSGTKTVDLPGMRAVREYGILSVRSHRKTSIPAPVSVRADGAGHIFWNGWEIRWADICGELTVRGRQPGDEIRLPGGTRTVKKLLIDRKLPKECRDGIPIVLLDGTVLAVGDAVCICKNIHIKERDI